jgi:hypothetical protein
MTRDEIYVSVVLPPENEISIKQSALLGLPVLILQSRMVKMCTSRFNNSKSASYIYGLCTRAWFSVQTAIISLKSINQLIAVMVKCGVLFEVRTEFLYII